jgi:hypothetical protein
MSKKLALSSALSVMMMAGFAVFGGKSVALGAAGAENAILPARIEMPSAPHLPELPILR